MGKRRRIATGASVALSTSYANKATITGVPDECFISTLQGDLDTIVTATSLTWFVSEDAAGDYPITDEVTETILTGQATADDGSVTSIFDRDHAKSANGVAGSLYVWAKLNAGTANLSTKLRFVDGD